MPECKKLYRKKRQFSLGDMNERITLQNRVLTEPVFNNPDFTETFTTTAEVWAGINTVTGKTWFDGVSTDINITHEIVIRYDATVTAETWILFDSRRIDILKVEDLDGRKEFMLLTCTDKGLSSAGATQA